MIRNPNIHSNCRPPFSHPVVVAERLVEQPVEQQRPVVRTRKNCLNWICQLSVGRQMEEVVAEQQAEGLTADRLEHRNWNLNWNSNNCLKCLSEVRQE